MNDIALICEADTERASMYRVLARGEGLTPLVVGDGEAARVALRKGPPALLLTELSLPKLDGFGVLRELKSQHPGAKTVVAVISGFREMRDTASKMKAELGIDVLLARSSPLPTIQKVVRAALARHDFAPPSDELPAAPEGFELERSSERTPSPTMAPPTLQDLRIQRQELARDRERRRLERIDALGLQGEQSIDASLQELVTKTAEAFGVPIALISLVLEDRQWFKAHVGLSGWLLEERGTPVDWSFCRHAVEARQPLVVPDVALNPYFATNPLVREGLLRSYAGVPLETSDGHVLGTLCLIDKKPLGLGVSEVDALTKLARRAAGEIEVAAARDRNERLLREQPAPIRAAIAENAVLRGTLLYLEATLDQIETGVTVFDAERRIVYVNRALAEAVGVPREELQGMSLADWIDVSAKSFDQPEEQRARARNLPDGPFALREDVTVQKPQRRVLRWVARPIALPDGVGQLCLYSDVTAKRELETLLSSMLVPIDDAVEAVAV